MRRCSVTETYAFNGKGKMYLFALTRRGRALERAKAIRFEVTQDDAGLRNKQVQAQVL